MNLYTGKDLNEALDKAADAENVDYSQVGDGTGDAAGDAE